nr:hypothetical protein [Tanacetum cinerariifolium]
MVTWHSGPPSELVLKELGPDGVALVWVLDMIPLPCSASKLEAIVAALPNPSCISLVMASSTTLDGTLTESIDEGPFHMGTVRETIDEGTEGAPHLGPERPQVYSDLSPEEKD